MDTELNPKLLDVVEFRGDEDEFGLAGPVTGTVVEFLAPDTALIEVSDQEGVPTDLITRRVEQVRHMWSVGVPPIEIATTDARTSFERGVLLLQNGLILDARSHFQRAFEVEPGLAGTLMKLANDLAKKGGFDAAILIYELIQELQPHYALARENLAVTYLNRGVQYARRGAIDKALDDFHASLLVGTSQRVVELAQRNLVATFTQLGIRHSQIKRYHEALSNFLMAAELIPSEITRRNFALGLISFATSKRESHAQLPQVAFFRRPMQMGLTLSECLNAYGATLATLGEISDAQRALAAAIEADPNNDLPRKNQEILSEHKVPSDPVSTFGLRPMEPEAAPLSAN